MRSLGQGGPAISVVAFGTSPIGGTLWAPVANDEALATLHRALELGITVFDTADAYGWGRAEKLVGRAFRTKRDEVFIATKFGIRRRGGVDLSPSWVRNACVASLKRLQTDYIDLYQIHFPRDESTRLSETWDAMCRLQDTGKVRFLGVSNFGIRELTICQDFGTVNAVQNQYSMLARDPERDVLPWCHSYGSGFLSYGSLAYGLLTGKLNQRTKFLNSDWRSGQIRSQHYHRFFEPAAFVANLKRVELLKNLAREFRITLTQMAVAWLLRNEVVTSAICGARNPGQIQETASAGDVVLDDDMVNAIERALN